MIKVALIDNCGADFYNYRVPFGKYLLNAGYDVYAIVPEDNFTQKINESGLKTLTYSFARNRVDILALINSVKQLKKLDRAYKFDIAHSFRLQPNVMCNLSFGPIKRIKVINHVTGLGFSFSNNSFRALFYRIIILTLYQILMLFSDRIICQNNSDKKVLSKLAGISKKIIVIEGSGIDLKSFSGIYINKDLTRELSRKLSICSEKVVITFVGRLLLEKGILEFIEAAKRISMINEKAIFLIIGWIDNGNPSYISKTLLNSINDFSNIIFLGERSDIKELLFISNIFVLPTYREGFSRSILEAMAMELPVITTDVPGAREAVKNNYNGILVKPADPVELQEAIHILINDADKRKEMGKKGRQLVEKYFSADIIYPQFKNIYDEILNRDISSREGITLSRDHGIE